MSLGAIPMLLGMFRDERRYNKELTDKALAAINEAIVATRQYEAKSNNLQERDREVEARIAGLWSEAAIATRHVNEEFAMRLNDKSLYWFNDFYWTPEEVIERQIDWNSIHRQVTELMGGDS
jgi:hypothetical protein